MQTNSRGPSIGASPLLPEPRRPERNDARQASQRGSTTPVGPSPSSTEPRRADGKPSAVSQRSSVQVDDYQLLTSNSSSILSGCETVAPQSRDASTDQPGKRRPYGLLTGLLSRRGDKTPRKSKSDGQQQQQQLASSPHPPSQQDHDLQSPSYGPSQVSPTHTVKPSSRGARNPLIGGFEGASSNASTGATQIGVGGYDWPAPPSPIQKSENLHPPASTSRHDLFGSPLLSLQSHSSPNGTAGRVERREKRNVSRPAEHGESHFVPLGSIGLADRGNSASVRRPEVEDTNGDETLSVSGATGRAAIGRRRRTHNNGIAAAAAASLSNSESQSNEQLGHTRGSQARNTGTDENELSAPLSSSNVRGVRDAKAALLRHAQGVNASLRTSRMQSFRRVPSNVGGEGRSAFGGDNNNIQTALPTHRSSKARGLSRERRSFNGSRSGVEREDAGNSLYSIGLYDDAVRMSTSPGCTGSPLGGRHGVLFPATAVNQEGNMASTSHVGTSHRFSRTDDGSGAILEVMETSALTSRGNVAGGSNNNPNASTHTVRCRSTTPVAKSHTGRHGGNASRDDAPHYPKHRHVLNGGYSLSRTGGYGDSEDSEDSMEMEERHRHKVDEVMRRLNRKSNAGNNQSTLSRAATSEVVAVLDISQGHSTGDAANSGTSGDNNNNSTSTGGGVMWSGIGGMGWGGLAGFGAADSTTNDEVASGGGTGGWAGLGGDGGSEDWYARMRRKAAEEEQAEVARAEAAANAAAGNTSATTNAKLASPGTVSITASPGLAPHSSSNQSSGRAAGTTTTPTTAIHAAHESPMPSVARGAGSLRASAITSVRSPGSRLSLTPSNKSNNTSANTSALAPRPLALASSRTPKKPSLPSATSENGITHVCSLTERFVRRPTGGAAQRSDNPQSQSRQEPQVQQQPAHLQQSSLLTQRTTPMLRFGDSPLEPPAEHHGNTDAPALPPSGRVESAASAAASGQQPTLPGTAATANLTASPARRASRNGAFLTAAVSASANVDGSHRRNTASTTSGGSAGSSTTGVVLPVLPPQRAETSTPLSSPSSVATTPGHRRFDHRRRASLPRVLPVSNAGASGAGAAATASTSTASSVSHPLPTTATHGRLSIASSNSYDTFGRGSTQPASPATSVSQHARGVVVPASSNDTVHRGSAAAGTEAALDARGNSSPSKRTAPPFLASARAGTTGLQQPSPPPGSAPKKQEGSAKTSRVIATSTRLSIS